MPPSYLTAAVRNDTVDQNCSLHSTTKVLEGRLILGISKALSSSPSSAVLPIVRLCCVVRRSTSWTKRAVTVGGLVSDHKQWLATLTFDEWIKEYVHTVHTASLAHRACLTGTCSHVISSASTFEVSQHVSLAQSQKPTTCSIVEVAICYYRPSTQGGSTGGAENTCFDRPVSLMAGEVWVFHSRNPSSKPNSRQRTSQTHPDFRKFRKLLFNTSNDPQILDLQEESRRLACRWKRPRLLYMPERSIHEAIQVARPQFQAHGYLVSIKNTSRTAGSTVCYWPTVIKS